MGRRHTILRGAFILTVAGIITRLIGFFYRIFLSHAFGEEGVGIYQLIFPVYALGYSLTCAGIEIAISRSVAQKNALGRSNELRATLCTGCFFSILFSFFFILTIQKQSTYIATQLLNEPRCETLLLIVSYALPFSALHSCICGYFLGLQKTKIPALSQLIEQVIRVGSVYFLYTLNMQNPYSQNLSISVAGIVFGEFASSLFCVFSYQHQKKHSHLSLPFSLYFKNTKDLFTLSIPLTANRVLLNILQSIEAILIPAKLHFFGYSINQSLSIYGVLTGMTLPCILFPSALTNSFASMLLPTVTELQTTSEQKHLFFIIKKVVFFCSTLGIIFCFFFIFTGSFIGKFIFHSDLAGDFLVTLAWMCPFLYTNGTLISIINGLGKTILSFMFNAIGLSIRIASIYFFIPIYGIRGYLFGLLISQSLTFILCLFYLHRFSQNRNDS